MHLGLFHPWPEISLLCSAWRSGCPTNTNFQDPLSAHLLGISCLVTCTLSFLAFLCHISIRTSGLECLWFVLLKWHFYNLQLQLQNGGWSKLVLFTVSWFMRLTASWYSNRWWSIDTGKAVLWSFRLWDCPGSYQNIPWWSFVARHYSSQCGHEHWRVHWIPPAVECCAVCLLYASRREWIYCGVSLFLFSSLYIS